MCPLIYTQRWLGLFVNHQFSFHVKLITVVDHIQDRTLEQVIVFCHEDVAHVGILRQLNLSCNSVALS